MSAAPQLPLAILISGRGSNMEALARACEARAIAARVAVVIADRSDAAGLELARGMGIPTAIVAHAGERAAFERSLAAALEEYRPAAVALAGFMRVLSGAFVGRYLGRLFNIHPSLLPKYPGLDTHRRALAAGDAQHGASVHFVTPELDAGPVVLQSRLPVRSGDTASSLAARVLATEHVIYPRALGWFADGRLSWRDGAAWLDGRPLSVPVTEDFK
ncbi:MAG TPA: phosphoribosylglycinamide formyltransferase [Steroidobacteraceae bacterium]|jgi:phosphoribosylglycinamide formyltransferase-1|nr:phosphoribosylglycinamide formyltransferase [Steroidobacteraceae bacterium]